MEGDSGVGEPGGAGVSEAVAGEVRQAEVGDDLVPAGGVANGGCREEAAPWTDEEWCVRFSQSSIVRSIIPAVI